MRDAQEIDAPDSTGNRRAVVITRNQSLWGDYLGVCIRVCVLIAPSPALSLDDAGDDKVIEQALPSCRPSQPRSWLTLTVLQAAVRVPFRSAMRTATKDTDRATQITHKVEETACIRHFRFGQRSQCQAGRRQQAKHD
jgi:hypothetical protein